MVMLLDPHETLRLYLLPITQEILSSRPNSGHNAWAEKRRRERKSGAKTSCAFASWVSPSSNHDFNTDNWRAYTVAVGGSN